MNNSNPVSPLRYPGGKACLTEFLKEILDANHIVNGVYYEFYAGGAGAALSLLLTGIVKRIVLNDADKHIYSFWYSILNHTESFIELINNCEINIENWHIQKAIYENVEQHTVLEIGFSTFFLNRCNRSGILSKAGPIGGFRQNGNYPLDVRFNKDKLTKRIEAIAVRKDSIQIYNFDAVELIEKLIEELMQPNSILYLDPPYYNKGKSLYLNYYKHDDHACLRNVLNRYRHCNWLVSYDQVSQISELYQGFNTTEININYSLQDKKRTKEIFIFSDSIVVPEQLYAEI